jgi:dTDP-4-dehydrorhamnose reductase
MDVKILLLGHTGLLGNMVYKYLMSKSGIRIYTTNERWPSNEFKDFIKKSDADYIINCIGAIHQRTKEFHINYELPVWLDSLGKKIIHPGTDCEIDNDDYGTSKRKARDFIVTSSKNTKIIKTSIIGIEINSNYSLMSWFLSNQDGDKVRGFNNHKWNGNTTLTWSKYCYKMINNWEDFEIENILYSDCVSKYELLRSINEIYGRKIIIESFESPNSVDKCIKGHIKTDNIKYQISELKEFLSNEN